MQTPLPDVEQMSEVHPLCQEHLNPFGHFFVHVERFEQ